MATKSYTIVRGEPWWNTTVGAGSAVGTDTVQLIVDYSGMTKTDVLIALENIKMKIVEDGWPPN